MTTQPQPKTSGFGRCAYAKRLPEIEKGFALRAAMEQLRKIKLLGDRTAPLTDRQVALLKEAGINSTP